MPVLMSVWGWLKRAWAWLKRDWHWLMVLTAGLGALLLVKKRPKIEVVSTELSGADEVKRELEEKKAGEEAAIRADRDAEIEKATEARDDAVNSLVDKQRDQADSPPQGSDLTSLLLQTGKDVRH